MNRVIKKVFMLMGGMPLLMLFLSTNTNQRAIAISIVLFFRHCFLPQFFQNTLFQLNDFRLFAAPRVERKHLGLSHAHDAPGVSVPVVNHHELVTFPGLELEPNASLIVFDFAIATPAGGHWSRLLALCKGPKLGDVRRA